MDETYWKLYKEFCDFAKLQDNSDADLPNCRPTLSLALNNASFNIPAGFKWDVLDDMSVCSPECLVYILLAAKEFWRTHGD